MNDAKMIAIDKYERTSQDRIQYKLIYIESRYLAVGGAA